MNDPCDDLAEGKWFLFRGRELLLTESDTVPDARDLQRIGLRPTACHRIGEAEAGACHAGGLAADVEAPAGTAFHDLRALYDRLPRRMMALAGRAFQILGWDRSHRFCGTCGAPTSINEAARVRVCTNPECRAEHYPRLAPVALVAVERGPEILLARSPHFPPGIYSVLAGFIEPGESAEEAARREVLEETGICIEDVRYFDSQPWPMSHSLLLGFHARYTGGAIVCQPGEIENAGFFHVDRLPQLFPGNVSVSQWLIYDFCARNGRKDLVPPLRAGR